MKNIVFLGPPGSGKGTQAEKLCEFLNIPHISTGEILRATINEGTGALADEVKSYVHSGKLVPDDIVIKLVLERIKESDCKEGYLLDGFPRSLNQAEALDESIKNYPLTHVILIDVDEDYLFKRLTGRRMAKNSGKIYNIYFNPPKVEGKCDETGEDLYTRDDDKPETVKKRLDVYKEQTLDAIKYYEDKGVLIRIDGSKAIDEVFAKIKEVVVS
jgi:adenylate kinase